MNAQNHFHAGDLDRAIAVAQQAVRAAPGKSTQRALLAEMLCLAGDYERADAQLETTLALDPATLITIGTWRQLLQAATRRREVLEAGAVPELVSDPSPQIKALLARWLALRSGDFADAAAHAEAAEAVRQPLPCLINGERCDDLRDADDGFAGVLELLTSSGKYFWVELADVVSLSFTPPERPLDLLWRRAEITLTSGTTGAVFIPAIYPTHTDDPQLRLGRRTDWQERAGCVQGLGQRLWLAGDEALPLLEIEQLDVLSA